MIKILKLNNKNSLKLLKIFLDKRKSIQKNQTSIVSKIIQNVKKNGDKAVLNYEKKFSQIKTKSNKILFSKKEINRILEDSRLFLKHKKTNHLIEIENSVILVCQRLNMVDSKAIITKISEDEIEVQAENKNWVLKRIK